MSDFIAINPNTSVKANTQLPAISVTNHTFVTVLSSAETGNITAHAQIPREVSTPQAQKNMSESEIWEQYKLVKAQSWNVLRMLAES